MRMNYWKCTRCDWWNAQRPGGGSISYGADGEVTVSHHNSDCPHCGGTLEFKSEIMDIQSYNGGRRDVSNGKLCRKDYRS